MRAALVALLAALLAGCGGGGKTTGVDASPSTHTSLASTRYSGPFANLRTSGTMSVAVVDSGYPTTATAATAVLVFLSGDTASVVGQYFPKLGHLALSGGGDEITGNIANGTITGTFSEPTSSGKFAVQVLAPEAPSRAFCGTYVTSSDYGWLNLVVSGAGNASGFAVALVGGNSVGFSGTVNGLTLTGMTTDSVAVQAALSPDGSSLAGTYTPVGAVAGSGTFQGSVSACSTAGASSNAGIWITSGNGPAVNFRFALVETVGALSGSGVINASSVPNWTGNEFVITSGALTGSQLSFTAQLGANPNGAGGFYYGTLTFSGTVFSASTIAGTLEFTPPRTATQVFSKQTVTGIALVRL